MPEEAIFRSAEMSLAQFYIPNEFSKDIVAALGELGAVQFIDLNKKVSAFQRAFVKEIRVFEGKLRQVRYLKSKCSEIGIEGLPVWEGEAVGTADDISPVLDDYEKQVSQLEAAKENLVVKQSELFEQRHVLTVAERFFGGRPNESSIDVAVVAGIIPKDNLPFLRRILWRSLRGNLIVSSGDVAEPIYDLKTKDYVEKSVFIVVTHGAELEMKAAKISEAMGGHIYSVNPEDTAGKLDEVNLQLAELDIVVKSTATALELELEQVSKNVEKWAEFFEKEKAVYEVLNRFSYDQNHTLLIGEGWIPSDEVARVQQAVKFISEGAQVESPAVVQVLDTTRKPPTYHRTNKVTSGFQAMVDVYAFATYREVNPGLPTVITFPFTFAVMFGDLGHGFIMALAAFFLVLNERKLAKANYGDIFDMAYEGRYVLLLMGLFSMYTGFVYNDVFSLSMTFFKSGWSWPAHKAGEAVSAVSHGVYAVGIDPVWHGAENSLLFLNSYKMKVSVLMGYVHMTYSHMFSLVNALYFKSPIDIIGTFIPGAIFYQGIFGYLSLAIVYKWCIDWPAEGKTPPSLLDLVINMFLAPGKIENPLYSGQKQVQLFLLSLALLSVPWLLLVKPLYLKRQMQQSSSAGYDELATSPSDAETAVNGSEPNSQAELENDDVDEEEEEEEESFGDILIHQIIFTIEWCLNSVSHTASYLRLWALSLAHAQLSQVLWSMTLKGAFNFRGVLGVIMIVCLFAMWMTLTVAVLVLMEGTSAMLHALRLHWVESMSKFYIGEGYPFEPFNFRHIST